MATSWVLGKISDALQPTVQNAVGTAGTFAGGAMSTVGSSINGVGERINTGIRYYGDGAKDYGNSVMDWTKSPATRAQTTSNPLGLSKSTTGGKAAATNPSIYRASTQTKAKSSPQATKPPASKSVTTKPTTNSPVKPNPANKGKPIGTNATKSIQQKKVSAAGGPPQVGMKKTISPESRPKTAAKVASPAAAKRPVQNKSKVAVNPLGLSK